MIRTLALCGGLAVFLAACDATNVTPDEGRAGSPETIASAALVLGRAAGDTVRVSISGLDGGTPDVSPDTLTLVAGARYAGYVRLEGEAEGEIRAEAESHRYVYAFSSDALTITETDSESRYTSANLNDGDFVLGRTLTVEVSETASGTGALTLRLLHYEGAPKTAEGTGGTEDLTVQIPVAFEVEE